MFQFRLLAGRHTEGKGQSAKTYKRGDIIETKKDLAKMFNSPDPDSDKKFERVHAERLRTARKVEAQEAADEEEEELSAEEDEVDEVKPKAPKKAPKNPAKTQKIEIKDDSDPEEESEVEETEGSEIPDELPESEPEEDLYQPPTMDQLKGMSVGQLRSLASSHKVDIDGLTKKSEIIDVLEDALSLTD